jgi:hypothetical protein
MAGTSLRRSSPPAGNGWHRCGQPSDPGGLRHVPRRAASSGRRGGTVGPRTLVPRGTARRRSGTARVVAAGERAFILVGSRRDVLSTDPDELPVYRIGAPFTDGQSVARSMGFSSRRSVLDRLDHLLGLPPERRLDWLARRGPGRDEGRTNWWLYHLQVIDFRISQQGGEQGPWIELNSPGRAGC